MMEKINYKAQLIKAGDKDIQTKYGSTALMQAANYDHYVA